MKNKMNRNNLGFTLVEILFAVSILLILALASASLAKLSSDSNRYADRKNAQSSLAQLTIENLRHANSCDRAMGPASGLSLTVDDTLIRQSGATGGWPLTVRIAGLNSGPSMTGDTMSNTMILPLKRLRVDELKLADAIEIELTATERTYLTSVYLTTSDVGGISHKPILVGTLTLKTSLATGAVIGCETTTSASIKNTCEDIGCTYNAALTPACRCSRTQVVCAAPGYMPVAFSADGLPDCRPIGGDVQCPPGEWLIGVGIDWHKCGPAPTPAPAPTPGSCVINVENLYTDFDGVVGTLCTEQVCAATNYIAPAYGGTGSLDNLKPCALAGNGETCLSSARYLTGNNCNISSRCEIYTTVCGAAAPTPMPTPAPTSTPAATSTPTPAPTPPVACYMRSETFWYNATDCDSVAKFNATLAACQAALESPTACNMSPDCSAVLVGEPMAVYCP